MSNTVRYSAADLDREVSHVFDPSSVAVDGKPTALIITGPVATGKTTIRRQKITKGFVVLDAGEIFLSLCAGRYFDFPTVFRNELEWIGFQIASTAIAEKRHLVCELNSLSCSVERMKDLLHRFNTQGYKMTFEYIYCDQEEAWRRNINRSDDSISSAFTDDYHWRWLYQALAA